MDIYFLDASALIKQYVQEPGSAWVRAVCDPAAGNLLFVAGITRAEVVAAISRRAKGGRPLPQPAPVLCQTILADMAKSFQTVDVTPAVSQRATSVAPAHALRGYDAVQLAAALEANGMIVTGLGPSVLRVVSADAELNAAAAAEGLAVEDPNAHP